MLRPSASSLLVAGPETAKNKFKVKPKKWTKNFLVRSWVGFQNEKPKCRPLMSNRRLNKPALSLHFVFNGRAIHKRRHKAYDVRRRKPPKFSELQETTRTFHFCTNTSNLLHLVRYVLGDRLDGSTLVKVSTTFSRSHGDEKVALGATITTEGNIFTTM